MTRLGNNYRPPTLRLPPVDTRHWTDESFEAVVSALAETPDGCDVPEWIDAACELKSALVRARRQWEGRCGPAEAPRAGEYCPAVVQDYPSKWAAGSRVYGIA